MEPNLDAFHPAVSGWFRSRFSAPTEPQLRAWPSIRKEQHTLIAAPTGSGKTLAAFLAAIDDLVRRAATEPLPDAVHVVYVSPLKALSNDIRTNLEEPLAGIEAQLREQGLPPAAIRALVRTGDTPAAERTAMVKRPPHILVTTPESLYILLTSEGGRRMLHSARTLIVDEIHAVADDKRGSHLSLTIERLDALVQANGRRLTRIGLSATQRPIELVAQFLVGAATSACEIVDVGHRRELDLNLELTNSPLEAVLSAEAWQEIYDRLAELIRSHRTTLIFVNTRKMAERVGHHLARLVGEEQVRSHHGSLSKEKRFIAEQRLKSGDLKALIATASLELGIDIGDVDLVCNIGSTRSIATLLQRVGRSGHTLSALPKGRLFPTSRDELVECAALLDAVRRDELERLVIPRAPLDILAQQIVATVAGGEWSEEELFALVRRAYPYRELTRESFDRIVRMLAEGFATRRGRRGAFVHHDAVNGRIRPRRGARLAALTSGGAIPENDDYRVVLQPAGIFVGSVNEDFAIESMAGDIFQLGNNSWRIQKIEHGRVLVEDAQGQPPSIPFWLGEAAGRTDELSKAVSRMREQIAERTPEQAHAWLTEELNLSETAASQIVDYLTTAKLALGAMPTQETLIIERFFDENGDQHIVLHSPFGSRLNRAWGLALRKRFCRSFNFELQAAATEDAIVLSLGPTHSYRVEETFRFLHSKTVRDVLTQALLDAPMFGIRWRWNASRALALLRWRGGKKVPPRLQRMQSEDLIALIFPDQLACLENIAGEREIPDHPLVKQTIEDCLEEAMDIEQLEALLKQIEQKKKTLIVKELREPSPLAHEILNAKPYAFLDDAPLEERRTAAVYTRRWLDPETAADLGKLDLAAIERVREEAHPDVRDADELHDALLTIGGITTHEAKTGRIGNHSTQQSAWNELLQELARQNRATTITTNTKPDRTFWIPAERLRQWQALHPEATLAPRITAPKATTGEWDRESALKELVRGRLELAGPVTPEELATALATTTKEIDIALAKLESEGFAMQGRFTPEKQETEWCERGLLARIHRYTLNRLRREIEPVPPQEFMRFLLTWHGVAPTEQDQPQGQESLAPILEQLEGFEAPAASWEAELLPARMKRYDPAWLDAHCLSGRVTWGRFGTPAQNPNTDSNSPRRPIRTTPISIIDRNSAPAWRPPTETADKSEPRKEPSNTTKVRETMTRRGACFFDEIVRDTSLLRTQVEEALADLVANGEATADSYTGLRALLVPSSKRPSITGRHKSGTSPFGMENAGRWSLFPHEPPPPTPDPKKGTKPKPDEAHVERTARILLKRYGVICRRLLDRESLAPPWRDLLPVYRRLEARGEIRGGRFVDAFSGEQFALPEAVAKLRKLRRDHASSTDAAPGTDLVSISAADPLNLLGIVLPGPRLPAVTNNRILFRDGIPIAVYEAGVARFMVELSAAAEWEARNALMRRRVPPQLRAYLGRSA